MLAEHLPDKVEWKKDLDYTDDDVLSFPDIKVVSPNVEELLKESSLLDKSPQYVMYPAQLDKKYIQKVIVNMNFTQWKDGPNGKKRQYVHWMAYSMGVYFIKGLITDRVPFVFEMPFKSFCHMFMRSAYINYHTLIQQLWVEYDKRLPMIEIHFRKRDDTDYEMKFLALTEYKGEDKKHYNWVRFRTLWCAEGYREQGTKVVRVKK